MVDDGVRPGCWVDGISWAGLVEDDDCDDGWLQAKLEVKNWLCVKSWCDVEEIG